MSLFAGLKGAQLVNSSENIQDLVDACLPSQDLRGLIQEVRARVLQLSAHQMYALNPGMLARSR